MKLINEFKKSLAKTVAVSATYVAFLVCICLSVFMTGCGGGGEGTAAHLQSEYHKSNAEPYLEDGYEDASNESFDMEYETGDNIPDTKSGNASDGSAKRDNTKLIRNVSIHMETKEYDKLESSIQEKASSYGGFLQDSNMTNYDRRMLNVTIRLPYEKVDDFMESIGEHGVVKNITDNTEDVTLQYADTETRLKNLNKQHERLLELLASAESLDSIISLEQRLSEVETEIDSYSIQLKNYDNLVDYSTVYISITEMDHIVEDKEGFFDRAAAGFMDNLYSWKTFIVDMGVSLIANSLTILLFLVFIFFVWKLIPWMYHKTTRNGKTKKGDGGSETEEENEGESQD